MPRFRTLFVILVATLGVVTIAAKAQYQARWDQIGGSWTTGWVDGNRPICIHGNGCACGGANFCGSYRNGQTTTAWPYGCGRPDITWPLQCTVRKARKSRARWDQVGGSWTTGWVYGNENRCGHFNGCSCGMPPGYRGWYSNGAVTTVYPYSCKAPNITWAIRCTVEEVPAGPPMRAAQRTFQNPGSNGYFVDRCLGFATNCDRPAADAFCRMQGFERASDFHWSYKWPTRTLAGGQICNAQTCGGFDYVTCQSGRNFAGENYAAPPAAMSPWTQAPSYSQQPNYSQQPSYAPQQQQPTQHQSGGPIVDTPQ